MSRDGGGGGGGEGLGSHAQVLDVPGPSGGDGFHGQDEVVERGDRCGAERGGHRCELIDGCKIM